MFLTAHAARAVRHPRLRAFSLALGSITTVCVLLLFAAVRVALLNGFFGLFERGYYVSTMLWLATWAVAAIRGRLGERLTPAELTRSSDASDDGVTSLSAQ